MTEITNLDDGVQLGEPRTTNDNEYTVDGSQYVNRRMTDLSRVHIRDDFLKITVGIKLEAGVSAFEIRSVIEDFVFPAQSCELGDEILAYRWVKNVLQERRNAFLAALAALSPLALDTSIEPGVISAALTSAAPPPTI